ncbi:MAG: winged helix-turn-helix domain-containing protein [Woeseiaceae bacterium]|nr:winged helix-turn-helix domain-containing protein [Woeseiaceae bacterium]
MTLASILVVDPDTEARRLIAGQLRDAGHDVTETSDAESALRSVAEARPDLVVCDFTLPDTAGLQLLGDVRRRDEFRRIRVLMTSARKGPDDAVLALTSGADDFVGKPIVVPEFLARVSACLRRPAQAADARKVDAGGIRVDRLGHRVVVDGDFVILAPREYRLLDFLVGNPERVFSRKELLVHVWDRDAQVGPRTVDVHIRRLRSVLEPYGYDRYLQTVRGAGYRFSLVG